MNEVIEKIKNWLLGLFVAVAFALAVIGALGQCSKPVGSPATKQVDTVLVHHRDTIVTLDTILKTRIKYIDTSRIDTVHDILDSLIPIDTTNNDSNQVIAANQLREAVKWKDSLNTCIDMRKADSQTIDTLSKLAKNKEAPPKLIDDAKKVGVGVLIGIAIKSFF